jgi:DNA polymerase III delta subunit
MKRMQQTNITHNEKVVHVVYSSDAFKEMDILEYGTDGLAEEPSNLSIFGEKNTGELNNSDSKGSEFGNESISNEYKSRAYFPKPIFIHIFIRVS